MGLRPNHSVPTAWRAQKNRIIDMQRTIYLWLLFALQMLCAGYFLSDILADFFWQSGWSNPLGDSDFVEGLVTLALLGSLAFTGNELRGLLTRQSALEDQLKVASGAFAEVLEARFESWSLTQAEREIALLAIKGFSLAEMADLRRTKQGTVKAQCASVYRKADVAGRLQLLSLFIDELLADDLIKEDK